MTRPSSMEYMKNEGHTFQWVYKCEKTYVKSMVTKFKNDTIKDPCLKAFAAYCMARDCKSSDTAYMAQQESEDDGTTELYVILDTGCNNTRRGSEWMVKYMKYTGTQPPLLPSEGRFRGVGGRVEVARNRHIPVKMKTLDEDFVPRSKLQHTTGSWTASQGQRSLGIMLNVDGWSTQSSPRRWTKSLRCVTLNRLPALRLCDDTFQGIAMMIDIRRADNSPPGSLKWPPMRRTAMQYDST